MGVPALEEPPESPPLDGSPDSHDAVGGVGDPAPAPSSARPPLFAILAFWAFVLGGFAFGGLFLVNWRALRVRAEVTAEAPVAGPVTLPNLPALPLPAPARLGEPRRSPSGVVKNLLPEWKGTDRINLLLLGIDRRDDESLEGTRSDTIMLMSIDPVTKSAAMVSFPRDLWVQIPGHGSQRINVAHALGGPELVKRTLQAAFDIPVSYFARVDFRGFEHLVDTLGGVIVDVDRPVKDDEYPTEAYGYQRVYIAPGPQLMDGKTALQYSRSRHSDNDFGRARRQQKVLVAMRDRALQLNMLPKAPQLVGIVQRTVTTDLGPEQMLALARLASEIDRDRITSLVVDTEFARPFRSQDGADVLLPDTTAIRRAVDRTLKVASHPELRARVEVLNGSGRLGYGQKVATHLSAQGYDVVRIAAADRNDYRESRIEVLTGNEQAGAALASALRLPGTSVRDGASRTSSADLRFTIGQDFSLPGEH
jgi:polyisoprenyl-teichoic acid--peptidoglycan teichoic acid transferase